MVGTKKEVSPLKGDPCEVRESAENIQPEVSLADVGERPLARLVYPLVPRRYLEVVYVEGQPLRELTTTPRYAERGTVSPRAPLSP